ncbi:MAG: uroporphyrinogen-III synthase [Myxococcota bacterium]
MRVLVTRASADAAPVVDALRGLGVVPVVVPLIKRTPKLSALRAMDLEGVYGWVMTSPAVVRALSEAGVGPGPGWVASVGPATTTAAREAGWQVRVQAPGGTARSLVSALGDCAGQRWMYPCADQASDQVQADLERSGALVERVVAYDNVLPAGARASLASVWPVDAAVLFSGSAARRLLDLQPLPWARSTRVIAIGPSTSAVLSSLGVRDVAVATPHTLGGVVEAVRRIRTDGGLP